LILPIHSAHFCQTFILNIAPFLQFAQTAPHATGKYYRDISKILTENPLPYSGSIAATKLRNK
jgi:hypothetical protein